MADATIKRNDTWPPLRGRAEDASGNALPLLDADSVKFLMKSGATLIQGSATVIDPPDTDGMNWSYTFGTADTALAGTFQAELEITWDSGTTPPEVETVPNDTTLTVEIVADQG